MRQLAQRPATQHQGGARQEMGQGTWRNTNMNAALQLTMEQRCLQSLRACRSLRRQMTAPELQRAYDAEMAGGRRHKVLMLLVLQHCRLVRAERLARIAVSSRTDSGSCTPRVLVGVVRCNRTALSLTRCREHHPLSSTARLSLKIDR
jgi:hypothetical protein